MLTPEQRIEAYTYCMILILADPDKDRRYPICGSLAAWWEEEKGSHLLSRYVVPYFPEFKKIDRPKSKKKSDPWWPFNEQGNLTRLSVLSACIEEVEKQIKSTI